MTIHLLAPKDQSKWPEIWHKCYNIWKTSSYKIKIWHDKDIDQLLKEDDENFFQILNTLPPIYKFDYVRFIILEKFSGAYFDMDVEITDFSFFNKLKENEVYIAEGNWNSSLSNHIMISYKSAITSLLWNSIKETSKYLILENLDKCKSVFNNVIYTAGPIFLSNYSSRWVFKYTKLGFHQFSNRSSKLSYSKHHETTFWLKSKI